MSDQNNPDQTVPSGKPLLQCVFTDIIISPICCDKQLNLGVKSN